MCTTLKIVQEKYIVHYSLRSHGVISSIAQCLKLRKYKHLQGFKVVEYVI